MRFTFTTDLQSDLQYIFIYNILIIKYIYIYNKEFVNCKSQIGKKF